MQHICKNTKFEIFLSWSMIFFLSCSTISCHIDDILFGRLEEYGRGGLVGGWFVCIEEVVYVLDGERTSDYCQEGLVLDLRYACEEWDWNGLFVWLLMFWG